MPLTPDIEESDEDALERSPLSNALFEDVRSYVITRPIKSVAIAFLVGVVLSKLAL
ncbi:MAG TPA: hypothetical protein VH107_13570 [Lacipirellulaceae bacterium]|jgi:hypothetical protein|nr:hypothetical protein [Lacipirellulaceae bacterium]